MSYNTKNYREQGGEKWVVGGQLEIEPGGKITAGGDQADAIIDVAAAAGATPTKAEFDAVVTALNAALAALKGVGIIAAE